MEKCEIYLLPAFFQPNFDENKIFKPGLRHM